MYLMFVCFSGKDGWWGDDWNHISAGAKDVVQKLLVVDPAKRMTAEQVKIMSHRPCQYCDMK